MSALDNLTQPQAALLQEGLKALGLYEGTTKGIPGPKTEAAFELFLDRQKGVPSSLGIAARMVALALKEVGVRESPRNSNRGKRVQEYQRATWHEGTGWPWCAAFICWLAKEAGMSEGRPTTPGAWDFENWARKTNKATLFKPGSKTKIRPGDIVVFTFSHIGLAVAHESDGAVKTVEGNTDASGSREGGGVYRKTRPLSQIRSVIRIS